MRPTQRRCQVEYYRGSMLPSLLFSVFVNGLEEVTEGTFSESADDTKLGGTANRPAGTAAIRKDLEMLKEGTRGNLMKFGKDNRQVLALGRTLRCRDAGWSLPLAGSVSAGRDPGPALAAEMANGTLGYLRKGAARRLKEEIIPPLAWLDNSAYCRFLVERRKDRLAECHCTRSDSIDKVNFMGQRTLTFSRTTTISSK